MYIVNYCQTKSTQNTIIESSSFELYICDVYIANDIYLLESNIAISSTACIPTLKEQKFKWRYIHKIAQAIFQFMITIQVEFIHCYRLKSQNHFISMHKHTQNTSKIVCVQQLYIVHTRYRYRKDDLYILIFQLVNMWIVSTSILLVPPVQT